MATLSTIERLDGPACPTCGCRHSTLDGSMHRCRYCQRRWRPALETPPSDQPVTYTSTRVICPICGRKNAPVYSVHTKGAVTIRYHQCGDHRFTSHEGQQ